MTRVKTVSLWCRRMLIRIPIYGQLFNSDKDSLKEAGVDFTITTMFSLLPIWVYPILTRAGFNAPFWASVKSFVSGGELFLYSAALVGPLIYAITKKYGGVDDEEIVARTSDRIGVFPRIRSIQFPYGSLFVVISIFICLFSALFFGLIRAKSSAPANMILDERMLFNISMGMYIFTLSCVYCVSVYRLNLERTAATFGSDTRELMKNWESRDD